MKVYLIEYAGDLLEITSTRAKAEEYVSEYWDEPFSKQLLDASETTITEWEVV